MSNSTELAAAQKAMGNFAPKLVEQTKDVLFGDVWSRKEFSSCDRSLIAHYSVAFSKGTFPLVAPTLVLGLFE